MVGSTLKALAPVATVLVDGSVATPWSRARWNRRVARVLLLAIRPAKPRQAAALDGIHEITAAGAIPLRRSERWTRTFGW